MKKIALLALIGMSFGVSATILDAPFEIFKATKEYGKDTKIGFELINKSDTSIWIALKSGGEVVGQISRIRPGETHRYAFDDLSKVTELAVWDKQPATVEVSKKWIFGGADVFDPKPTKLYEFTKGKTIYLTWDKEHFPRPQTGFLKGLLSKTDSGLSLKNNITLADIKTKIGK